MESLNSHQPEMVGEASVKKEKEPKGRTLHLVLIHNFEIDKATGKLKIAQDPHRLEGLIGQIAGKSEIIKIYTGTAKENDPGQPRVKQMVDLLTEKLAERDTFQRRTLSRSELQRLPGTSEYYSYLASKAKEDNPELAELSVSETLKAVGPAIYDLWQRHPDPAGEITTADEMNDRYQRIIERFKKVAERSPAGWPEATIVLIVDRAVHAWLFSQTSVSSQEMGMIQDDEPIEITFTGNPDETPSVTFKGQTYPLRLNMNKEVNNE